jgi:hypothetical protein
MLIGVAAMAEGVQDNFLAKNVVPQPVLPLANAPLSLARLEPGKFLDLVFSGVVVGVLVKDCEEIVESV